LTFAKVTKLSGFGNLEDQSFFEKRKKIMMIKVTTKS